jgi:hypothetical protein
MSPTLLVAAVSIVVLVLCIVAAVLLAWVGFTRDTHRTLDGNGRRVLVRVFGAVSVLGLIAAACLVGSIVVAIVGSLIGASGY